jgi:hypothetical protein
MNARPRHWQSALVTTNNKQGETRCYHEKKQLSICRMSLRGWQWLGFREKPDEWVGCWKQLGVVLHFDIQPCERWENSWTPRPVRFQELQVGEWFESPSIGLCMKIDRLRSCLSSGGAPSRTFVAVTASGLPVSSNTAFPACQVTRAQPPGADQ